MKNVFLHIDLIDIALYFMVNLYILFSKFSKKKDLFDDKQQAYNFTQFWKVYWDNYTKVIILTAIGLILKDEIGIPFVEYLVEHFISDKINIQELSLNYALTAIIVYVFGRWGVKFKDNESL